MLFGETMVHSFGYAVAFIVLGGIGVLNLLAFAFFYSIDSEVGAADLEEKEDKHGNDETDVSCTASNDAEKKEHEHEESSAFMSSTHLEVVVEDP